MTQDRRIDDRKPTEPLAWDTDRKLIDAALQHLRDEKAASCLVEIPDSVPQLHIAIGTRDAMRGLLRDDPIVDTEPLAGKVWTAPVKAGVADLTAESTAIMCERLRSMGLGPCNDAANMIEVLASTAPAEEAKPVAWMKLHGTEHGPSFTADSAAVQAWAKLGVSLIPLFTRAAPAAQPDEWPTPLDLLAENLDNIAEGWTACMYDAPGETIDIGADLRRSFAKLIDGLKSAAPTTSQPDEARNAARYTCIGKGGEYALVGVARGAGKSKLVEPLTVYRDIASGALYFRTGDDFAERMEALAPTAASPSHPDPAHPVQQQEQGNRYRDAEIAEWRAIAGCRQNDAKDAELVAAVEEAAQVFESAASHNRKEGRTVFAHEQQTRANRLRAALAAHQNGSGNG